MFNMLDANGDGFVTIDEVYEATKGTEKPLEKTEIQKNFEDAGITDGRMDFNTMVKTLIAEQQAEAQASSTTP